MAFVKFTEAGRSFAPKCSINPRGTIAFNEGAKKRYNLGKFSFCILYYDADTKKIGIRFTSNNNEEGVLKIRNRKSGIAIAAKSFFDFFNAAPESTMMYAIEQSESGEMFIIDTTKGRKRNKREKNEQSE